MSLYHEPAVRERIRDFLGLTEAGRGGAISVRSIGHPTSLPLSALPSLFDEEAEIERSLWDQARIIADLDIEHVNFDDPAQPFLDPHRSFALQRPVVTAIQRTLAKFGVFPLHLISGRGHHFVWSVPIESHACDELAALGSSWSAAQESDRDAVAAVVPMRLEEAFVGLGMALEWVAHQAIGDMEEPPGVSVQLTDVRVGSGQIGRECISIDLSEYGDPLRTRYLRIPFTYYRKPRRRPDMFGDHAAAATPDLIEIPMFEMSESEAISVMRDAGKAAQLAKRASVCIPEAALGTSRFVRAYSDSRLAQFHLDYYEAGRSATESAAGGGIEAALPRCARKILQHPNDLLLQPGGMQHIVRTLLALGWRPRNIARLIQRLFEEDHNWGERWKIYEPARRADFYTRLFSGAVFCGYDGLVDFNSISHIEKGYCSVEECECDLSVFRRSLQERLTYERLGCRPFNRLFSSQQHL